MKRTALSILFPVDQFHCRSIFLFQTFKMSSYAPLKTPPSPPSAPSPRPPEAGASAKVLKNKGPAPREPALIGWWEGPVRAVVKDWLPRGRNPVSGNSTGEPAAAAAMATAKRLAAPPLWPIEARLAALLPDLLVFRKPRGSEPELATAQGVLLGVHVTGEGEGRRVALPTCWRASARLGRGGYGRGPGVS